MQISLCITTYNSVLRLGKVLQYLTRLDVLPGEVLICDDGSGEETAHLVRSVAAGFPVPLRHLWHADEGWQVSKTRNMGIREAQGDYIVFIDGDCVPHGKLIADHLAVAEKGFMVFGDRAHVPEPFIEAFTPRPHKVIWWILLKRLQKRNVAFRNPFEKPRVYGIDDLTPIALARLAVGCNIAFWKADAERVNGFNEELTGWALEDIEMSARVLVSGIRAKKVYRRAIVYHLDHPTSTYDDKGVLKPTKRVFENRLTWAGQGLVKGQQDSSRDTQP